MKSLLVYFLTCFFMLSSAESMAQQSCSKMSISDKLINSMTNPETIKKRCTAWAKESLARGVTDILVAYEGFGPNIYNQGKVKRAYKFQNEICAQPNLKLPQSGPSGWSGPLATYPIPYAIKHARNPFEFMVVKAANEGGAGSKVKPCLDGWSEAAGNKKISITLSGHSCGGGAATDLIDKIKKEKRKGEYKNIALKKVVLLDTGGCRNKRNYNFSGIDCVNVFQRKKRELYGLSLKYDNKKGPCKNIEIKAKNAPRINHFNIAGRNEFLGPLVESLGGFKSGKPAANPAAVKSRKKRKAKSNPRPKKELEEYKESDFSESSLI